jgi:hypothetical protein
MKKMKKLRALSAVRNIAPNVVMIYNSILIPSRLHSACATVTLAVRSYKLTRFRHLGECSGIL